MANKYLKPMLDTGSPRVFNCNEMTRKLMANDPNSELFFKNKPLNTLVLIKDTVPENERTKTSPSVGTKLYFPFNENDIYEGGRTIFRHDKHLEASIMGHYGEGALNKDTLATDLNILSILDKLPSLDPFLLKDVFIREGITVNNAYFEVSQEAWEKIETFMLQQFEPLVMAAFPEAKSSDEKARMLIDKMWEARDVVALQPLIDGFRLPQSEALNIFSSWRGIVYYSYQYKQQQILLGDLIKWLKDNEAPVVGVPAIETKEMLTLLSFIRERVRAEWQSIEEIVRSYQNSYDRMFRLKESSTDFLNFLRKSGTTYWTLGNSLGKINHTVYCWDVLTNRFKERKTPWAQQQELARMLAKVLEPDKKTATAVSWQ